jgi:hypothetical protein
MGLGSGKKLFRIPDPVEKKAPVPGIGSALLIFGMCKNERTLVRMPQPLSAQVRLTKEQEEADIPLTDRSSGITF